ncbi:MRG/MORF4L-binding protein isoform X3 [Battus philenor]|uniref:MRG/MORF4L-binding protein isoform X3 n=1 Tax=Battus philenor TaxID=42288 RepID=UPI0035D13012
MVSSEEESDVKAGDTLEWDVEMEIQLFYAMANHKPVGINKHFHMACIWEKLSNSITKEISTHDIWKHLEKLYDMSMLEDTEPIPFPNSEVNFSLPENEFGPLIKQKCKETLLADDSDGDARSPSPKASTPRSNSRGTASKDGTPKDRRRDSRDSNASGPRDSSTSRKSLVHREKTTKSKITSVAAWDSPLIDEDGVSRRGRRRANASTPPTTTPAKRRRT